MSQPVMTNDNGVILTVGMASGTGRSALVIPLATDAAGAVDAIQKCKIAVSSFKAHALLPLTDCFSGDAAVVFLQAEGMVDGSIPYREDYLTTDFPGARANAYIPESSGALIAFYEDPADIVAHARMRVGKTTIPYQANEDWDNGLATVSIAIALTAFGLTLLNGFLFDPAVGSDKWYRVLASVRSPAATNLKRVAAAVTRGYVGTQRRRLIPHA